MACKTPEGEKEFREAMERRGLRIYREQADPFRYGYEPDHWKAAEEILKENDDRNWRAGYAQAMKDALSTFERYRKCG